MFKTVEEFKVLKSENPFFRNMNIGFRNQDKQKNLFSNKLVELNLEHIKNLSQDDGFVDKKLAKETIDQATRTRTFPKGNMLVRAY